MHQLRFDGAALLGLFVEPFEHGAGGVNAPFRAADLEQIAAAADVNAEPCLKVP